MRQRRRKCGALQGGVQPKAVGGHRARAERTRNMPIMLVTLDVSKVSGWLNADVFCRVARKGMRCGARGGPEGARGRA